MSDLEARIMQRMAAASKWFPLMEDGDRILVGVSGGKDSLCLLEMLGRRQRIRVPRIRVEAAHVRMREVEYETSVAYLKDFAAGCGGELHVRETGFARRDDSGTGHSGKPVCFLCSWARRKALFDFAQQGGFNKIALGHHQDDIILTALMNLTFQGSFSTMPAYLEMRKMPLSIVRPLCYVPEALLEEWAMERGYEPQAKRCPQEHATNRTEIRTVLEQMERLSVEARSSIWHALRSAGKLCERADKGI